MNQITSLFTAILLFLTLNSFGQTSNSDDIIPTIEVIGSAEKNLLPDEIYIAITLRERENGKDKIKIDQQEKDLKEGLKSIGVSLENLTLSDANANYVQVKWSKKDVITKIEYILKVSNAMMVGMVFEKLDELKITDAEISKVSHSKIEDFKKEVRIMAITAAKEKADYLLKAIGQQTGKAIKVNEQNLGSRLEDSNLNIRGSRSAGNIVYIDGVQKMSVDSNKIIQFEKIKLQSAIYVKFEIK